MLFEIYQFFFYHLQYAKNWERGSLAGQTVLESLANETKNEASLCTVDISNTRKQTYIHNIIGESLQPNGWSDRES